jgi:hypothetical protein
VGGGDPATTAVFRRDGEPDEPAAESHLPRAGFGTRFAAALFMQTVRRSPGAKVNSAAGRDPQSTGYDDNN